MADVPGSLDLMNWLERSVIKMINFCIIEVTEKKFLLFFLLFLFDISAVGKVDSFFIKYTTGNLLLFGSHKISVASQTISRKFSYSKLAQLELSKLSENPCISHIYHLNPESNTNYYRLYRMSRPFLGTSSSPRSHILIMKLTKP